MKQKDMKKVFLTYIKNIRERVLLVMEIKLMMKLKQWLEN